MRSGPSPLFRNAAAPLRRGISEASGSEICLVPILLAPVFSRSPHIFGHNSESHHVFLTKIGGNLPLSFPVLSIPTRSQNASVKPELLNPKFLYKIFLQKGLFKIFFSKVWGRVCLSVCLTFTPLTKPTPNLGGVGITKISNLRILIF